ncbi:MAG: hypothetical protein L6R35_006647 [Caloplaca aegaea]|nr:MAG: hypothetical protein L6R35_006647 [Caloplaca aegaea]
MSNSSEASADTNKGPIDLGAALQILSHHNGVNLYKGANKELPPRIAEVVQQVMSTAFAEMDFKKASRIIDVLAADQQTNEASNFGDFWFSFYETLKSKKKENNGESDEYEEIEWSEQGLYRVMLQEFDHRAFSPLHVLYGIGPEALKCVDFIQIPQARIAFGFHSRTFTDAEFQAQMQVYQWGHIVAGIWHPFLLIESQFESPSTIDIPEIKMARAGSVLVEVHRLMKSKASMLKLEDFGVDASTIVFSLCLATSIAKLYVHWASVDACSKQHLTQYHMKQVRRYLPNEQDSLINMRQDLERILDWGASSRLNGPGGVREMLAKINGNS